MFAENENPTIPPVLRCLLFEDAETKRWVAHCLDFDLATSGKDEDLAWSNLKAVVRLHVEHCFTHWQDGFKKKASAQEVANFEALRREQPNIRSEKISFKLVPPQAHPVAPLWMQGVEGGPLHEGSPVQQVH